MATLSISGNFKLSRLSKNVSLRAQSAGNQRRFVSSLVGTSETTRATTNTTYNKQFCEWLAGIIDGDGCLLLSKQGYTSLEITMGQEDLALLRYIQNKIGGNIKMRSGAKAYRYRLHNREGMIQLINCINGYIRHSSRLPQLHRVCLKLNIPVVEPVPMNNNSHWFAGFFDADGTIGIYIKNDYPQLSIRVTNKLLQDVQWYKNIFGGYIYFDSSQNGYYSWSVQSREHVLNMLDYFLQRETDLLFYHQFCKSNICRSRKSKRFFLIEEYYYLKDLKAFKENSIHHKEWLVFMVK
jgi:hypothetical protein